MNNFVNETDVQRFNEIKFCRSANEMQTERGKFCPCLRRNSEKLSNESKHLKIIRLNMILILIAYALLTVLGLAVCAVAVKQIIHFESVSATECEGDRKEEDVGGSLKPFIPPPPTPEEFPWQSLRLPLSIKPLKYNLLLQPYLDTKHLRGSSRLCSSLNGARSRVIQSL